MSKLRLIISFVDHGCIYSVSIEASKSVEDLKAAILEESPSTVICNVGDLQIFLAKTTNGKWLSKDEAIALDEHGNPTNYQQMDPSSPLTEYFSDSFHPDENQIQVLVKAPECTAKASTASELSRKVELERKEEGIVRPKRKRYVHSEMNLAQGRQLLSIFDVKVEVLRAVPLSAEDATPVEQFKWEKTIVKDDQEIVLTEDQQQQEYRTYLETNIGAVLKEKRLCVLGVEKDNDVLTVKPRDPYIELSGRADLLILSDIVKEFFDYIDHLPEVRMLIEVEKDIAEDSLWKTLSKLIALDLLAEYSVMALLTDLKGIWRFFWVSEKGNKSACIYTTTLDKPGDSFQVIRALLEQSPTTDGVFSFPCLQTSVKCRKLTRGGGDIRQL